MAVPRPSANLGGVEAADLVAVLVLLIEEAGAPLSLGAIVHAHLGGRTPRAGLDDLLRVLQAVHPVLVVVALVVLPGDVPLGAAGAPARLLLRFEIGDFLRSSVLSFRLRGFGISKELLGLGYLSLDFVTSCLVVPAHGTLGMAVPRPSANLGGVEAADLVAVLVLLVEEAGAPLSLGAIVHAHLGGRTPRA